MASRKLFFITNDDGIDAPGLHALEEIAGQYGDVLTVAPRMEMSGISHALTLHAPLRVHPSGPGRYSVSGTPADCVYLGLNHLADRRPDLTLSGVNHGPNLGYDVLYSGTVAGARESLIQGVPALAFSLGGRAPYDFGEIRPYLDEVLRQALEHGVPPETILNVNVPAASKRPILGYQATTLGIRSYSGDVERRVDPRGGEYVWIGGKHITFRDIPGSDCNAVRDGFVSVTAVQLDSTSPDGVRDLSSWSLFGEKASEPRAASGADK